MYSPECQHHTQEERLTLCKELCKLVWEDYNITKPMPNFIVKYIANGWAVYSSYKIIIPTWIFDEGEAYYYCYILHEITHFIEWLTLVKQRNGHTQQFKDLEIVILKTFNMVPIHSRAYVRILMDLEGNVLYQDPHRTSNNMLLKVGRTQRKIAAGQKK